MAKRNLSKFSVSQLQDEIERRREQAESLVLRREELVDELEQIDAALDGMGVTLRAAGGGGGGSGNGRRRRKATRKKSRRKASTRGRGGRKRPRNDANLVDSLAGVLKNTTMSVTDVSEAVQKAGYKTTSPNFRTIVNQTLINNPDRFKRISRGQYTAK